MNENMDLIPEEIQRKTRSSHGTCRQNRRDNKNSGQPYNKLVNAEPVSIPGKKIPTTVSTSYDSLAHVYYTADRDYSIIGIL